MMNIIIYLVRLQDKRGESHVLSICTTRELAEKYMEEYKEIHKESTMDIEMGYLNTKDYQIDDLLNGSN